MSHSQSPGLRAEPNQLNLVGDCVVRELDFSKVTIRLRESSKDEEHEDESQEMQIWKKGYLQTLVRSKIGAYRMNCAKLGVSYGAKVA